MDQQITYDALLFPSDGRAPHLVQLTTSLEFSPMDYYSPTAQASRVPMPQIHMDYIADVPGAWAYHPIYRLDGMNKDMDRAYAIFYPVISRDSHAFPINRGVKDIQGDNYLEPLAWRGNLVVAKFSDSTLTAMINISMADFPIVKNYLFTHGMPSQGPDTIAGL